MAQKVAVVVALVLCMVVLGEASTYIVGGSKGWTFNVQNWPSGKKFKAGDVLVFNYKSIHDVAIVNAAGYRSCTAYSGSRIYKSGPTRITLKKGMNYFICTKPGHCKSGQKIAVNAY